MTKSALRFAPGLLLLALMALGWPGARWNPSTFANTQQQAQQHSDAHAWTLRDGRLHRRRAAAAHRHIESLYRQQQWPALANALHNAGARTVTFQRSRRSHSLRADSFPILPGWQGQALDRRGSTYTRRQRNDLCGTPGRALSQIARAVLSGRAMPDDDWFPTVLRQPQATEIMVLLRQNHRPLLWRSARANHCISALRTALAATRARWQQRLESRTGALHQRLHNLDVELWQLRPDGYLAHDQPALINVAVQPNQGIGFEYRNRWHYLLPETLRASPSTARALAELFTSKHIDPRHIPRSSLRVYRFHANLLSRSHAQNPSRHENLAQRSKAAER